VQEVPDQRRIDPGKRAAGVGERLEVKQSPEKGLPWAASQRFDHGDVGLEAARIAPPLDGAQEAEIGAEIAPALRQPIELGEHREPTPREIGQRGGVTGQ
jgi:hypothetical protein